LQPLRELLVFELEPHELIRNAFVAQSELALKPPRIELTLTSPALMVFTLQNDIVKGNGTGRGPGRGQGQGSTGHGRGQGLGKGNCKGEGLSKDQRSAGRGQGQSGRGQRQAAGRDQGPGNISRQVRLLAEVQELTAVAT
jgi:hypothetical protein